jgi:hypothetical protein
MTTITSPARQPFAALDGARLRNLTNAKNKQNGKSNMLSAPAAISITEPFFAFCSNQLTPSPAIPTLNASTKRRYTPEVFNDNDSENVDPNIQSPSKKSKNIEGLPVKAAKPFNFVLKQSGSSSLSTARSVITPKRLESARKNVAPLATSSAPTLAPAGRSPKSKRVGILSRRRVSASPFTRIDPPTFGLGSNAIPLSIDAALSGSISSYKPKNETIKVPTLEESMPAGWVFDIHEDTPDEELGNLMEFSTQTLDISDDENRLAERDDRGKENVPPPEFISLPTAISQPNRRDAMSDEVRSPLGDLDAREYYAEGCDANSFILVPAEKDSAFLEKLTHTIPSLTTTITAPAAEEETLPSPLDITLPPSPTPAPVPDTDNRLTELMAQIDETKNTYDASKEAEKPTIEIWESESAKATNEQQAVLEQAKMVPIAGGEAEGDV